MDNLPLLYSKKEAARLLSVSIRTIDYLLSRQELESRKLGKRVLIPRHALEKFSRSDHRGRLRGTEEE
jgi:excisionase family DNA binding protein